MKLATIRRADGETSAARVEAGEVVILPFADVGALLRSGETWRQISAADGERFEHERAEFVALLSAPGKVACVGRNYLRHVRDAGGEVPEHPTLFAKFPEALTGPYDDIPLPSESVAVDWEAELVVVLGAKVRRAGEDEAAAAIAGFTVGNDVSMRDWQSRAGDWLQGKTWEACSPIGPMLVTEDEVGGVRPDLRLQCTVDDEVMQDARTSDLLFDPVDLVSYISTIVTLLPGDLIFSGSPPGVGKSRTPPLFLKSGQVMTTEIEGIAQMRNKVVVNP
jgi:acylpyruvate hydrolase